MKKFMIAYNRFVDSIIKVIDLFIAAVTAAVIVITIASVFMRYVFSNPFSWAEEICLMGFAWFTFMGAGSAVRKRSVVSLDFFYDQFKPTGKKIIKVFTTILMVLAYVFIIYYGFKILDTVKMTMTAALRISYTWLYIVIPVGGIVTILALVANLFDVIMGTDTDISEFSEEANFQREADKQNG